MSQVVVFDESKEEEKKPLTEKTLLRARTFSERRPNLTKYLRWTAWTGLAIALVVIVAEGVSLKKRSKTGTQVLPVIDQEYRWGIAGLGRIGHDFAVALTSQGGHLEAVAAGSLPERKERAAVYHKEFGATAYDDYKKLADDPKVDIVYVSVTNQLHANLTVLFLEAGKHVLVEKPTAMSSEEVLLMIATARKEKKLFVTNFWNAAFPAVRWAEANVGKIGPIFAVRGDFAFQAIDDPNDRFLNKKLGGGATMDMGCYLIQSQLSFLLPRRGVGPPQDAHPLVVGLEDQISRNHLLTDAELKDLGLEIHALGDTYRDVDSEVAAVVTVAGTRGLFGVSLQRTSPFNLEILAAHGSLSLAAPANCPASARLQVLRDANLPKPHPVTPCCGQPVTDEAILAYDMPPFPSSFEPQYPGTLGFAFMIHELHAFLTKAAAASEEESGDSYNLDFPLVPHWMQLATQQIVDAIIRQVHASQ